jgi:uncharacterized protein (DUF362 family)
VGTAVAFLNEEGFTVPNPYRDERGRALVTVTGARGPLREDLRRLIGGLGGLGRRFRLEESILLKPNINSHHPSPAAVDPEFLAAFIDLLQHEGYTRLAVAESSGRHWAPTERVVRDKEGLLPALEERGVPFLCLDDMEWEEVETGGQYLPRVHLPQVLGEYDRLIFLPNLKTHGDAGFTVALKLAMGFTPLCDRELFHRTSVAGAVVDLARVLTPDLVVVDGRKAFIAGGPTFGTVTEPGVLIASGDAVACDTEAARILIKWGAAAHLGTSDPHQTELILRAQDLDRPESSVLHV